MEQIASKIILGDKVKLWWRHKGLIAIYTNIIDRSCSEYVQGHGFDSHQLFSFHANEEKYEEKSKISFHIKDLKILKGKIWFQQFKHFNYTW